MALEVLQNEKEIGGFSVIIMDKLKEKRPDLFNESGAMDYKKFESDVRPRNPIQVRLDKNSISFTIQNGPIKEVGVNGCQVDCLLHAWVAIVEELNEQFPSKENSISLRKVKEAIFWQDERTRNREKRGVEGTRVA